MGTQRQRLKGKGAGKIPIPWKFLETFVPSLDKTLMEGEETGILPGILE